MIDSRKSAELNNIEIIELYNWFEKYPQSNKRIICYCEECGKERNISYYNYTELCKRCANGLIEKRERSSITIAEYWNDLKHREEQSKRLLKFNSENPNDGKKRGIKLIQYHKDNPSAANNTSMWMKEYWEDSNWREKLILKLNDSWDDIKRREDMSIRMSEHWGILKHCEMMSAAKQGISYDEWENFASKQLYCPDFNEECKESNREKYDRKCFLTGLLEEENITSTGKQKKLAVHHVDMDKGQGCNGKKWKLVPLCIKWHGKVHNELWESRIIWLLDNVWN